MRNRERERHTPWAGEVKGGSWTNMLLRTETMVSDRRSEMRNFSDPEISLAGLKQRNATYAFLEIHSPIPPTSNTAIVPTTSMLTYYSLTHEDIFQCTLWADACSPLLFHLSWSPMIIWSSGHSFSFPFSLSLSQQRCAGSFIDTWRCFCFHSLFGVPPKCDDAEDELHGSSVCRCVLCSSAYVIATLKVKVTRSINIWNATLTVPQHNNHQLIGSVIKIQRQHNEDSNDPRWHLDDLRMTCLSAWLPVWLAEETQSQMGLMTFRLICDPCVLSR